MNMGLWLLICFVVLTFMGMPIGASIGLTAFSYFMINNEMFFMLAMPQRIFAGLNSFELLAVPMFILAGDLLYAGKVSKTLVDLANALIGHVKGGMGMVATVACMFFGAVSGSGPATSAAVGAVVAPEMEELGYPNSFTAAVIASAGPIGVLIPPSIMMVVYGVVANLSIATLLLAGVGPGLLYTLFLCLYIYYASVKNNYGVVSKFSPKAALIAFKNALWALLTPIIILGGIYSGFFTPTEAAVVTVFYALIVGMFVYKAVTPKTLPTILLNSAVTSASIMFIVAAIACLSWVMTRELIHAQVATLVRNNVSTQVGFLLLTNVVLIFAGMVANGSSIILLMAPLLHPVAMEFGIDPIFYGTMFVANLAIGMVTPPVAVTLYVAARVCKVPIVAITRAVVPFFFVLMAALFTLMMFPEIALFLPRVLLGYGG